jgi:hypothetical protein
VKSLDNGYLQSTFAHRIKNRSIVQASDVTLGTEFSQPDQFSNFNRRNNSVINRVKLNTDSSPNTILKHSKALLSDGSTQLQSVVSSPRPSKLSLHFQDRMPEKKVTRKET